MSYISMQYKSNHERLILVHWPEYCTVTVP